MKAIGTWRHIVCGGPNPIYGRTPYYGKRQKYLPMVRRVMTQIQVIFLLLQRHFQGRESTRDYGFGRGFEPIIVGAV